MQLQTGGFYGSVRAQCSALLGDGAVAGSSVIKGVVDYPGTNGYPGYQQQHPAGAIDNDECSAEIKCNTALLGYWERVQPRRVCRFWQSDWQLHSPAVLPAAQGSSQQVSHAIRVMHETVNWLPCTTTVLYWTR